MFNISYGCRRRKDQVSIVGIATYYGLDGRSNPGRGRNFQHPSRPSLGSTQPPLQRVPGISPGVDRPGRGFNYSPHLAPKLNKEQRCTSATSLGLYDLLQGEIYPLPLPHTRVWVWFELVAIYHKSTEHASTVNFVKVTDLF